MKAYSSLARFREKKEVLKTICLGDNVDALGEREVLALAKIMLSMWKIIAIRNRDISAEDMERRWKRG